MRSVPVSASPETVTVLPVATVLSSNVPTTEETSSATSSFATTPCSAALVVSRVAFVVLSKIRVAAVMPVTVRVFGVMDAVVVGWVIE